MVEFLSHSFTCMSEYVPSHGLDILLFVWTQGKRRSHLHITPIPVAIVLCDHHLLLTFLVFRFILFLIMCLCWVCAYQCNVLEGQKRALHLLELELPTSCCKLTDGGAETRTWCKSGTLLTTEPYLSTLLLIFHYA